MELDDEMDIKIYDTTSSSNRYDKSIIKKHKNDFL